jgi:putative ABC transport system substrate-binding protein
MSTATRKRITALLGRAARRRAPGSVGLHGGVIIDRAKRVTLRVVVSRYRPATLVLVLVLGLLAHLPAGEAQAPARIARIGYLSPLAAEVDAANLEAFRQGLRALGQVEGQNVAIETRYAEGKAERLPELAAQLVRLKVDVIVAAPTSAIRAAQHATKTIPIVMAFAADPVGEHFVAGLARPGGNITGHSSTGSEIATKRVELLKAVVPRLAHVSHLVAPDVARRVVTETEAAGRALGVQVTSLTVGDPKELDSVFSTVRRAQSGGLIVALTVQHHWKEIAQFALKHRLPTVSGPREFVEAGGLMAYGPHYPDLFRRSAAYVDKILRDARPADLPIEQPLKFDFVISTRTAKALGVTIPPALLLQVDRVLD